MPEDLVRLDAAAKRYALRGRWVLRDVSVALGPGAAVRLRGANGSGKSTLLRLLAGATTPTRGRRVAAAELAVGYAPERLAPPPLTASAYLRHHERVRGVQGAAAIAERLGLGDLVHERMPALSKGSLQKVVLAQALLGEPGILALDEPYSGLDGDARAALRELLAERCAAGAAIVVSGHDPGDGPADPPGLAPGGADPGALAPDVWTLVDGTVQLG